ncbi:Tetratricopeptide repeat-containing protein [Marininema mesophilum]|uniref:Tetratricopeptide repeat-containing protein n=1 Tax=Marininema mesophilum TaxID=1048340 RepID=A0A1H2V7N6_9BACL|nr:helix-turn-helix transcriptional regulator [Marininema mesophilum]SDW64312.1 Tetratricopeptide repeat-containing protein [Marininema mesophilum]
MEPSKIKDVGEAIRRVRKSKGLRLEDLADENISPATISNIERGITHVNTSKVYYLVEKLGLSMSEVPGILLDHEKELEDLKFNLSLIEMMIDLEKPKEVLAKMDDIAFDDSHPYASLVQYLRGKAYLRMKNWKRAERYYAAAISISSQNGNKDNIEASSFLDLSMCCYAQNEMEKALEFANSGLDTFNENAGRNYVKYILIRNKAVFLERLGKFVEGLKVLQDVWGDMNQCSDIETTLTFYSTRADLLRKTGMIEEAIQYAKEGLELARINKHYRCLFDMLTILGSLNTSLGQWDKAEICFNTALASQDLVKNDVVLTDTYIWLGILHTQQEKQSEAQDLFLQAITNAEKHDDAPKLTYALRVMGDFLKDSQNSKEAIPYYQRALQLAQKFNYKKAENKLHFRLSQCYKNTDQKEFEKSLLNIYKTQIDLKNGEADIFEEE